MVGDCRCTATAPLSSAAVQAIDLYHVFSASPGLREAGAGGSNPLTPTNEIKTLEADAATRQSPKRQQNTPKNATSLHRCYTAPKRASLIRSILVVCLALAFDPHILLLSWSAERQETVAATSRRTCEAARDAIAAGRWLADDPPAAMRCERGSAFAPGSDCIEGFNCGPRR